MREKTLHTKAIYTSDFLSIREDTVLTYQQRQATRIVVDHSGASAILPITKEGLFVLVKQYRHPIGDITIEIPAGKLERHEDPQTCALRECEEEAQVKPTSITYIQPIHNCLGYSNEVIHLFIGHDCEKVSNPKPKDIDESFEILYMTKSEIFSLLKEKTITDLKTLMVLYHALYVLNV
jgi:ADP-ribose pyrophosphatase